MGASGPKWGAVENKQGLRSPSEELGSGQVVGRTCLLSTSLWSHPGRLRDSHGPKLLVCGRHKLGWIIFENCSSLDIFQDQE